ncbi:Dyp-type peroxidase family [Chromobacterium violaceum]|uniref:Dyp-type peroxidase family n=1 Tax=Chromobacterium violaceum TaxID=536 RepID=A0A3S5DLF9_CHRVL|nr:Dyp-type peroxidase family [Chromobacterium violaceum]
MLAAKVCGRWRNGNPLTLMPSDAGAALPPDQLNAFHYVSDDVNQDDTLGLKCPIGSHIRRSNPRDGGVVGAGSPSHRIVRRAMPYGPEYDPAKPDQQKRGLIGYFINASLSNQFEFVTSQWALDSHFVKSATGPGGRNKATRCSTSAGGRVPRRQSRGPKLFHRRTARRQGTRKQAHHRLPRLIHTRGGAYCFFPSISGLRYLARLASG